MRMSYLVSCLFSNRNVLVRKLLTSSALGFAPKINMFHSTLPGEPNNSQTAPQRTMPITARYTVGRCNRLPEPFSRSRHFQSTGSQRCSSKWPFLTWMESWAWLCTTWVLIEAMLESQIYTTITRSKQTWKDSFHDFAPNNIYIYIYTYMKSFEKSATP